MPSTRNSAKSCGREVPSTTSPIEGVARCNRCGCGYEVAAWGTLSLAKCIEADEIRRLIVNWPRDIRIEVRRCTRCGHLVPARQKQQTSAT